MRYLKKFDFFQNSFDSAYQGYKELFDHICHVFRSQNDAKTVSTQNNTTQNFDSSEWESTAKIICSNPSLTNLEQNIWESLKEDKRNNPYDLNMFLDAYQNIRTNVQQFLQNFIRLDVNSQNKLKPLYDAVNKLDLHMNQILIAHKENYKSLLEIWDQVTKPNVNTLKKGDIKAFKDKLKRLHVPEQYKKQVNNKIKALKWEKQALKICESKWKFDHQNKNGNIPNHIKNPNEIENFYQHTKKRTEKALSKFKKLDDESRKKLNSLKNELICTKLGILDHNITQSLNRKINYNNIEQFEKELKEIDIPVEYKEPITIKIQALKRKYMTHYLNTITIQKELTSHVQTLFKSGNYFNLIIIALLKLNENYHEAWERGYVWRFNAIKSDAFEIINKFTPILKPKQKNLLGQLIDKDNFFIRQKQEFFFLGNKKTYGNTSTWSKINNLLK